ncbi:MAG: TRAP transporter large permease, partial [Sandaracinaceae bacterium]
MELAILGVMLVLLLLGYPMKVPLLAAAVLALLVWFPAAAPETLVQQMIGGVQPSALIAVPMFILAAQIMTQGQAADRLLGLVNSAVGHIRGGLPITTAVACALFGALSGSTQATVVAIGGPLRPKMLDAGYSDAFSIGLIINASDIALLIPPSIAMIVYGVVSGTSIGELFIAGIGPGVLVLVLLSAYCYVAARRLGIAPRARASWAERWTALKRAALPLGFPVVVIGGIYSGVFSPTEAAAISVLYAIVLEVLVFRSIAPKDIPKLALDTGLLTSVVFVLVAAGAAFSWVVSYAELPTRILAGRIGPESGYWVFMGTLAAAYFVGCMFVDPIVVILSLTPILHPVAVAAGIDPG